MNILLTSCVSPPPDLKKKHHNSFLRLLDLLETVKSLIVTISDISPIKPIKIEIIDNSSGEDTELLLKTLREIMQKSLLPVRLTHVQYDSSLISKGKGMQEYLLIKQSHLIHEPLPLLKLSGRYNIINIERIVRQCLSSKLCICKHNIKRQWTDSYLFFLPNHLINPVFTSKYFSLIDDSKSYFFEHALYDSLLPYNTSHFCTHPTLSPTFRTGEHNKKQYSNLLYPKLKQIVYDNIFDVHLKLLRNAASKYL